MRYIVLFEIAFNVYELKKNRKSKNHIFGCYNYSSSCEIHANIEDIEDIVYNKYNKAIQSIRGIDFFVEVATLDIIDTIKIGD